MPTCPERTRVRLVEKPKGCLDHLQEVPEKLAERVIHSNGNGANGNGK